MYEGWHGFGLPAHSFEIISSFRFHADKRCSKSGPTVSSLASSSFGLLTNMWVCSLHTLTHTLLWMRRQIHPKTRSKQVKPESCTDFEPLTKLVVDKSVGMVSWNRFEQKVDKKLNKSFLTHKFVGGSGLAVVVVLVGVRCLQKTAIEIVAKSVNLGFRLWN